MSFGRYEGTNAQKQDRKANTFDVLGLTHYCTKSRHGGFLVGRVTAAKKFRKNVGGVVPVVEEAAEFAIVERDLEATESQAARTLCLLRDKWKLSGDKPILPQCH